MLLPLSITVAIPVRVLIAALTLSLHISHLTRLRAPRLLTVLLQLLPHCLLLPRLLLLPPPAQQLLM